MGSDEPDYNPYSKGALEAQTAGSRRTNLFYYGGIGVVIVLLALGLGGAFARGPESVVTAFLDGVMTGGEWSDYYSFSAVGENDVIGSVVRGYDVKNVVDNVVSVDVTFESKAGTDMHKTLRFTVDDGKVVRIK